MLIEKLFFDVYLNEKWRWSNGITDHDWELISSTENLVLTENWPRLAKTASMQDAHILFKQSCDQIASFHSMIPLQFSKDNQIHPSECPTMLLQTFVPNAPIITTLPTMETPSSTSVRLSSSWRATCHNCPDDSLTCNDYDSCNSSEYRELNPSSHRCMPMKGYFDDFSFVYKSCIPLCLNCMAGYDCFMCLKGDVFNIYTNECEMDDSSSKKGMIRGLAVTGFAILLMVVGGWVYQIGR